MNTRSKERRAGYQSKPDAMREMADKLMDHPGHAPDVILSQTAHQLQAMRPYKKGGHVKKAPQKECFAAGGVAKVRLGMASKSGKPQMSRKKVCA